MRTNAALIVAAGLLLACAGERASADAARTTAAACAPAVSLPNQMMVSGTVVLFGEVHGIAEVPALFAEAVCQVAARGLPVAVGLELPTGEAHGIGRYLASAGSPEDRAALLGSSFWKREYQDGRSSEAMASMLDRLRVLRAAGRRIDVFTFDAEGPSLGRDQRMAEEIAARVRRDPTAVVYALTGNLHARTIVGTPWNPQFRPMGWFLRQAGVTVVALNRAGPAGPAWGCTGQAPTDCGVDALRASIPAVPAGAPLIGLAPDTLPDGYDGWFLTRTTTASPPARGARRRDGLPLSAVLVGGVRSRCCDEPAGRELTEERRELLPSHSTSVVPAPLST